MGSPEQVARPRRRGQSRHSSAIEQMPWRQVRNPHAKLKLISDDEVEALHQGALRILEEIGCRFFLDDALAIVGKAGARVEPSDRRVRIGRELVAEALKTVPSSVRLTPRNPAHAVTIGGDDIAFATVLGPPYCTDIARGRRQGNMGDYADFLRLAQFFNIIHLIGGSPVEPIDIPVPLRHLESTKVMLELTDKVPYTFCQSVPRIHDALDMIAIARGLAREDLRESPSTYSIINTNSPLQYDTPMAAGVIEMARYGQPVLITPFTLAGATTPTAIAGGLALAHAEFLAGLVLSQLTRPGAPVLTGAKLTNVDMRTGSPAFASPEFCKTIIIGGQLARRFGIPYRASNFNTSNTADAQAAYEAQGSIWSSVMGGANLLMHAAGWLEGGLCSSFDKFVLDVEMLQMMVSLLEPIRIDEGTLAFDEIAEVGPGGHFFATANTIANYRNAFSKPLISTTRNYGAWVEDGSPDATRRAHAVYKQALGEYVEPVLDPGRREALAAFVAKRTEDGGAPIN